MRWALLLLAGCATHDVLHSEPLVARTACHSDSLGVFGYPFEQEACGAQITNLGDGCYLAVQPPSSDPVLYECAADTPDGHVACVRDMMKDWPPWPYGDARSVQVTWAVFPGSELFRRSHGRCRDRRHDWSVAHGAIWPRVALGLGEVRLYTSGTVDRGTVIVPDDTTIDTGEDAWSMARIIDYRPQLFATACAGGVVTLEPGLPSRFAQAVVSGIRHKLAVANVALARCQRISVAITAPRRLRELEFAR